VASPLIHNGIVFEGSSDHNFRALDLASGRVKWMNYSIQGFVETKPLLYEDKVIFGAWDTYLYALDERNGKLIWKWSNGIPNRLFSPAACIPVGSEGKVFIVAPDRQMTAIDAGTGTTVWRTGAHQVREMLGISEDAERIYVRLMNDSVLAFSASRATPTLLWQTDCQYGYDIDPSAPVEKDGALLFGTKNGLVYSLDAKTGSIRWVHKLGNTIVNTVRPLSDRRVLVTTMDGKISLIESAR
jgi:outer membrane protein assembly factor BamB